jgi:serine protease AprX
MARSRIIILLFILTSYAEAQTNQYFVFFKDKAGTPFSITTPSQFLSARSIERRQKQNIAIIEEDLPVNPAYVNQVKSAGAITYFTSRWWNGVLVEADAAIMSSINSLSFVNGSVLVAPGMKLTGGRLHTTRQKKNTTADQPVNQTQLQQIGLDEMHATGLMRIASCRRLILLTTLLGFTKPMIMAPRCFQSWEQTLPEYIQEVLTMRNIYYT